MMLTKMHWLLGWKSKLSTSIKIFIYKALKPIWTYGIQLWGMDSTSNTEILEFFQSKSFVHDCRHALVCAEYGYSKGTPNTNS
jgi:hypothetical protein